MRDSFVQSGLGALVGAAVLAASLTLTGNLSVGGSSTFTGLITATAGGTTPANWTTTGTGDVVAADDVTVGDVLTVTTSGTIAGQSILTTTTNTANDFMYGTGYDGDCNFDGVSVACGMTPAAGVYTMTRPLSANNITGSAIVDTAGWPVMVQGTMGANTVIFRRNANSASGSTGGAALSSGYNPGSIAGATANSPNACTQTVTATTAAVLWCPTNTASNAGNSATPGTVGTACRGGGGGGSTVSGAGASGGQVTQSAVATDTFLPASAAGAFSVGIVQWGMNTGGGCGAGDGVTVGGGGGGGGPWNIIYARNCGSGLFTVQSRGGNGASRASCSNAGRGCGGGGGGSGGVVKVLCGAGTVPSRASFKLDASPGCGGAGAGPVPGQPGGNGGSGYILTYSPATGWVHSFDSTPWTTDGGGSCPVP